MKNLLFKFLPVLFIILLWFVFSYPYFIQHRVPFSSTYSVNFFPPWNAYHLFDGPVKNDAMPDIITQMYPWRYFTIQSLKSGQIPLWNPYSLAGTPHLANYQSAVLSPLNVLFFIFSFIDAWSILVLLQPLLAGLFTYLYSRSLKISKPGSLISSIAFMFCGFMVTWMDYATLGYAILFLPLALFAIEKFLSTAKYRYLFLLAISIPLSFFSGHFQISLYFFLFILVYALYKYFQIKNIHTILYILLAIISGLLMAMPQILPSLEFYTQSLRSSLFQQIEAIPLGYLPTFLSPDFFGNPVTRNDWFGHYAEWNGYIGLLPFMLGIYAIVRRRSGFIYFLSGMSLVILLLAFNTPLLTLLIALHIPVLSTSAASRIIVLFSFWFAILAGFGFDSLLEDVQKKKMKWILFWIGFFCLLIGSLWAIVILKLFIPIDKIAIAKQNLKLPTILFGITAIVIFLSSCISSLRGSKRKEPAPSTREKTTKQFRGVLFPFGGIASLSLAMTSTILILLIAFDLFRFATKWQAFDPKIYVFPQVPVMTNFPQKNSYERIFGDDNAQVSVYYQLPSIEGYDPLYIKRYGEFIASANGKMKESERSVVSLAKDALYTPQALTLLDVKYILQKNSDNYQPWGFPFAKYPAGQFNSIYNDNSYQVYRNNLPIQHVFLAQNYIVKTNPQDILNTIFNPQTHLNNTVVLEQDPHIASGNIAGNANITGYTTNQITISAETNKDAILFLSEIFAPGWKAYIDGKETPMYRADYTFRAIILPQGAHAVIFRYEPLSFTVGCWMFVIGIISIGIFSFLSKQKLIQ